MMRIKRHYFFLLLLCLFFALSCASTGGDSSKTDDELASGVATGTHIIFPHKDNFSDADQHGLFALNYGTTDCAKCHDLQSTDKTASGKAPGCQSCHILHSDTWLAEHPAYVNALKSADGSNTGTEVCATQCHGTDLGGGLSKVSCANCHAVYPSKHQQEDWDHGTDYLADGSECSFCHGEALTGSDTAPSCYQCHTTYPHENSDGNEWKKKSNHGLTFLTQKAAIANNEISANDAVLCTTCHDGNNESIPSCSKCHSLYGGSHTYSSASQSYWTDSSSSWSEPVNHGNAAEGSGRNLCKGCHGDDLTGGDTKIACDTTCHPTVFSYSTGHPALWGNQDQHGYYVDENSTDACATQCHGTDLSGGLSGISCKACHDGATYPHSDDFISSHGIAANSGKNTCTSCHGDDLTGGNAAPSCYSCHPKYPHPDNWARDGSDLTAEEKAAKDESTHHVYAYQNLVDEHSGEDSPLYECQRCHGENFDEEVGGVKCTDCHPNGFAHDPNSHHGTYFLANYSFDDPDQPCQDCHGALVNLNDTLSYSSETDCKNCHNFSSRSSNQTRDGLKAQSDCYQCHLLHTSTYEIQDSNGNVLLEREWKPDAVTSSHVYEEGHIWAVVRSPLVTDESGDTFNKSYLVGNSDTNTLDILEYSCAGSTEGMCHYNGYRAPVNALTAANMCTILCHQEE